MATLVNRDGVTIFDGEALVPTDTVVTFVEAVETVAYTAEIDLPVNSAVEWVIVITEVAWRNQPTVTVGDSEQAGAFLDAYPPDGVGAWQWPTRTLGTVTAVTAPPDIGTRDLYTLYPEGTTLTLTITEAAANEDPTGITKIIVHHHVTERGPTPTPTPAPP